ncbi:MAG TPA: acyl-CoA dehydrogenase family protein [Steroidobacteraceae bacterium]|nr:acyl-CoA dehydrogenase family protein [Steroidobacteraceae bacterium]
MWTYRAPLRDMQFVIFELLPVAADWSRTGAFAQLDAGTVMEILHGAARFASERLLPLNASGDAQGCHFEAGSVRTPAGFAAAYREFCEAGWPALACDPEAGGQGLPQLVNAALYEMLNAANHAWTMYPGLAHGAYECLRAFASEPLKREYLGRIVDGTWLATMCLTEPQAGSDLSKVATRAEAQHDGSYLITGSKIFISGGEQDLTPNIVHMLLARLPDSPPGTRGLSLFLVPKLECAAGGFRRNAVYCDAIEKKLGIRGSATCLMRFEGARGWLIGEPHRGLAAMFVMMNAARLHVGLQGLGHGEAAFQNALRYALERVQGARPIAEHAAVRRTLLTLRAFTEGQRALAYWCAHLLDVAQAHPDAGERARAADLAALLTPVVKSFLTENGYGCASAALQVWGGYGYLREYGIEQCLRDSRIALIYEGTNEIQSLDLLTRKVLGEGGNARLDALLQLLLAEASAAKDVGLVPFAETLATLLAQLRQATRALRTDASEDPELPQRVAGDYTRLLGLLMLGGLWARAARLAARHDRTDPFYRSKADTAQFYFDYLLPEASWRLRLIESGRRPLPHLSAPAAGRGRR